jgi:hypothetical protein
LLRGWLTIQKLKEVKALVIDPPSNRLLPGDANVDGQLDLSDGICLLELLFLGGNRNLPCGSSLSAERNVVLLDTNGDARTDLSDTVYLLRYLFLGGPAHVQGELCRVIDGCPDRCRG